MNKILKLAIIISVMSASLSFSYYYVIYLPQKNQASLKQQNELLGGRADSLKKCLDLAEQNYEFEQTSICEKMGDGALCSQFYGTPKDIELTKILQTDRQLCADLYK